MQVTGASRSIRRHLDARAYHMHSGGMEVEFDPAKAAANLKKHRISFAHAEQSLRDPLAVTVDAHHFRSKSQPRRGEDIPCVRNTISRRASVVR